MNAPPIAPTAQLTVQDDIVALGAQRLFCRRLTPGRGGADPGPTLVFLHEALGCTAMWHDFPDRVARATGLPALIYDRAGHGRSSAVSPGTPDKGARDKAYLHVEAEVVLPHLLERLHIDAALLVGHSDGGSIALLAAAACPARIVGIVTEAAHVFVETLTRQGVRKTLAAYEERDLEARLARYHGDQTRTLFFAWAHTWLSPSFRGWNIEARLGRIRCPALVIQGTADPYGTPRQVEAIVAGIGPRAAPLLIPGGGHTPHREAPDLVRDAIAEFAAPLIQRPPAGGRFGGLRGES